MRLSGKTAIIIGGSRGIGEASATAFAKEGARLTIAGRSDDGEMLAGKLREGGCDVQFVRTDVTSRPELRALIDNHVARLGSLDILFNNAAYPGKVAPIDELDEDEIDRVIASTYESVYFAIKYAVPHMARNNKGGAIINTTAAPAREGFSVAGMSAYLSSKGAVITLTRALAVELGPKGIRVNSLNPGAIETGMLRDTCANMGDMTTVLDTLASRTLLGRIGNANEMAAAALFLASDESSYVTGIDLLVDGGITLGK